MACQRPHFSTPLNYSTVVTMRRDECRVRQCDLHIINDSSVLESTVIMAEVADFILLMFGSGEISVASHFSI